MTSEPPPRPRPGNRPSPAPRPPEPEPAPAPVGHVAGATSRTERRRRARRDSDRTLRILLVVGLVCALGCGTAAWLLWSSGGSGHPASTLTSTPSLSTPTGPGAQLTGADTATAFMAGAAAAVPAVTTYDYRHLDDALAAGLAVSTGTYRAQYQAALTGPVAAAAQRQHVVHTFSVLRVGIGAMDPAGTEARVLIFGQQQITDDSTHGQPRIGPLTLCATMQRIGNRYLIGDLVPDGDPGLAAGSHDLQVAVTAGGAELANLLTYRRASFAADLGRALAGATSPLRDQVRGGAAATQKELTRGGYDLSGAVTAVAVSTASDDTVTLLVEATSSRIGAVAGAIRSATVRYQVTVVRISGSWLVSEAQTIGAAASS